MKVINSSMNCEITKIVSSIHKYIIILQEM